MFVTNKELLEEVERLDERCNDLNNRYYILLSRYELLINHFGLEEKRFFHQFL